MWQDRLMFRAAYRQNERQFRALAGKNAQRPGFSWPNVFVLAFSVLMLALVVAIAAVGAYVTWTTFFDFRTIGGIVLILVAVVLRPRLGRLGKDAHRVRRDQAPTLFALIDEVSAATGAKPPHDVVLSDRFNASTTSYGLLRRRLLVIGLPLWVAITAQQRVALLGHELAHFVNGDVRRGPLTSLAFSTLGKLSMLTAPSGGHLRGGGVVAAASEAVGRVFMRITHEFFALTQTAVSVAALRSTQRGEYYADALAVKAAGAAAMVGVLDVTIVAEGMVTVLRSSMLRRENAAQRVESVQRAQAQLAPMMPGLRQLSIRDEASLFSSHPPTGLRIRMVESRPQLSASVVLSTSSSARIDEELATAYRQMLA
jgi:heat shock protein HtpX